MHNEEDSNNMKEESQSCSSSLSDNIIVWNTTAMQPVLEETNLQLRSVPFSNLSNINTSPSRCSGSRSQSSDICNTSQSLPIVRNSKKRKLNSEDVYIKAVESIAESIKMPSTPVHVKTDSTDPVDTCVSFLRSLLKKIQSRDIQLDVMNTLVQTVVNASTMDLERAKRK